MKSYEIYLTFVNFREMYDHINTLLGHLVFWQKRLFLSLMMDEESKAKEVKILM